MTYIPDTEKDLLGFLDSLDEESRDWRDKIGRSSEWERNIAQLKGDQWPDTRSKPMFLAPVIAPALERKAAQLTENRPFFDILPLKSGYSETVKVLKATIRAGWDEQRVEMSLEQLAAYLQAMGNGFFNISWDAEAAFGLGDIVIQAVDPRLLFIDPLTTRPMELNKAQYIIEHSVVPLSWIKETYPRTAVDVTPDTQLRLAGAGEEHKISWVERVIGGKFFQRRQEKSAIPRVWLRKYWVADPDRAKYPGGRLILRTGDNHILNPDTTKAGIYGQQNPYYDGLWPYEMIDNKTNLDSPFGDSDVRRMLRLQEAINRTGHTYVRNLVRNVPWIIADANSISPETLQQIKQLEEVVVEKSAGRSVERQPAQNPGSDVMQFMDRALALIDLLAGNTDTGMPTGGRGRVELRSAPQLEGLQTQGQVLIRAQARRLEDFLERVGQKWISRIFQFYTADRLMTYTENQRVVQFQFEKSKLRQEILKEVSDSKRDEAVQEAAEKAEQGKSIAKMQLNPVPDPEEILDAIKGAWRHFRFRVVPFSSLASTRMQRTAVLRELAQQGLIPMSMIMQEAGFDNWEELIQQAAKERQALSQTGFQPPPPQKGGGRKKA